jgi:hypothetical protein
MIFKEHKSRQDSLLKVVMVGVSLRCTTSNADNSYFRIVPVMPMRKGYPRCRADISSLLQLQCPPRSCIDVSSADNTNSRFCCLYFCWACTDQASHETYTKRNDLHTGSKQSSTRYTEFLRIRTLSPKSS